MVPVPPEVPVIETVTGEPEAFALTVTLELVLARFRYGPLTRPVRAVVVMPEVRLPVAGNWPSALALPCVTVSVSVTAVGLVRLIVHVAAKLGYSVACSVVEARAQVPPVIMAVPLATWAPVLLVISGSLMVRVATLLEKDAEVSVRVLLAKEPVKGMSCVPETQTVPGFV